MMRSFALVALSALSLVPPARAVEVVIYRGATLVREEDRGMMVFEVKGGEIKAQPSPNMKGIDLNGKVYSTGFAAAEKHEIAWQLLKVGNQLDLKINKVNAKTAYIEEARLVKGEVLPWGSRNKVVKADKADKKSDKKPAANVDDLDAPPKTSTAKVPEETPPPDKRRPTKAKAERHSYIKATIKSYDNKTVTFEARGEEVAATVPNTFKAIDRNGRVLKKEDRFRVFKEGNEASISTTKTGDKEVVTTIKLMRGSLADR